MKLIVGLGNPGSEYAKTRHNLGFMAVDLLHSDNFSLWKLQDGAYIAKGKFGGAEVVLIKPQSFMNLSGQPVQKIANFYKIKPADIVVVHDELDLPLGEVRSKVGGGSAGHNGIKDIVEKLGSPDFARVRIGMRTERAETVPAEAYVLEEFTAEEMKIARVALDTALKLIEKMITQ